MVAGGVLSAGTSVSSELQSASSESRAASEGSVLEVVSSGLGAVAVGLTSIMSEKTTVGSAALSSVSVPLVPLVAAGPAEGSEDLAIVFSPDLVSSPESLVAPGMLSAPASADTLVYSTCPISGLVTVPAVTVPAVTVPDVTVPTKKTWANMVQNKSNLSKFEVAVSVVDGKSFVAVPDEILEDSPPLWEDFLVGRFPSEAPHVAKIHVIVNKIWNLGDKSIRIDVFKVNDKTVKFRIRHASARQRVLRRSMWNICDLPMVVSKWTPIAEDAQPEIKTMPMWVTIKNVPNSMFTWKGLSYLASPLGTPKRLHPETEQVVNFDEAKIFVEVDMTKELPKKYYFQIKGMEVGVSFEYPWLPPRCGICGKWGHSVDTCVANVGKASGLITALSVKPSLGITIRTNSDKADSPELVSSVVASEQSPQPVVIEEGEIVSPAKVAEDVKVGEWQTVTHSSGSTRDKALKQLVFGQVRIASPTRFDVLRDEDVELMGFLKPVHVEPLLGSVKSETEAIETITGPAVTRENVLTVDLSEITPPLRILPSRTAKVGINHTRRKNSKQQQGGNSRCIGKKVTKPTS